MTTDLTIAEAVIEMLRARQALEAAPIYNNSAFDSAFDRHTAALDRLFDLASDVLPEQMDGLVRESASAAIAAIAKARA